MSAKKREKREHTTTPEEFEFRYTAHEERHLLETVEVPIVTVSATFREELYERRGIEPPKKLTDVTFSRAHYSMANALVIAATQKKKTFWMVDPTNYTSAKDWPKVLFTEKMGKIIARHPMLKEIKDMIETRARNKLPITGAIQKPLSYLFHRTTTPIVSFHYESGNSLVEQGKTVLQIITDPHVRSQYFLHADKPNIYWAVFDQKTKSELIELAFIEGKKIDEERVFITGAPTDPRIEQKDKNKSTTAFKERPLRLAITTGGLGTNKQEIKKILQKSLPLLQDNKLQLACFAGVHEDFVNMFDSFADKNDIEIGDSKNQNAKFRVFYNNDIVDANELILKYIFPWADGFITKPSGDMAYEAIAAGCFLLTLEPWGEWETNIRQHFEEEGISKRTNIKNFSKQIKALTTVPVKDNKPWVQIALEKSLSLQKPLAQGVFNILQAQQELAKKS